MLDAAVARYADQAATAGNVEIDLRTGRRASRHAYLSTVVRAVTDAEDGFAVNNNAGALLLALASVAGDGGRVAVSRGELIEIGGSFRLPELMRASGATLVEVGTTNRTRISDFHRVAHDMDAILKVHPSNYRIEGFQEEASTADLARLASERGIPFIHDVGSGLIDERAPWLGDARRDWLAHEPGVRQSLALGSDLVLFSGDKLLGGPQAGVVVGSAVAVERARRHPIARAVRLDGGTIAALGATLECYLSDQVLTLPFWRMASASVDEIGERATVVSAGVAGTSIVEGGSVPGAGSVPGRTIPTRLIRIEGDEDAIWSHLASDDDHPVVGFRRDGAVHLDLRSVLPRDDDRVRDALQRALG
jgi:L-seryl-tRNA(Ser) seleniumtransferase